jgi:phosphoesterase RecJ-like protein
MKVTAITEIISKEHVEKVRSYIEKYNKIVITTHLSPDGDALGSSLALYHYLSRKGKDVKLIVPNSFPLFLEVDEGGRECLDL